MTGFLDEISPHLDELRKRLITSLAAVLIGAAIAFSGAEQIAHFLMLPLFRASTEVGRLIYTNLTEAFVSYLKVALLVGLLLSMPVILFELWRFVAPGLYRRERRAFGSVIVFSSLLFLAGAAFAYAVVLPQLLGFFLGFAGPQLEPLPQLDAYLAFVARMALAFGLAFEIPFVMAAVVKLGLVSRSYFQQKRYPYYLAIFVVAVLLTGGDLFSAVLLTAPLLLLYEAGSGVSRFFGSPA